MEKSLTQKIIESHLVDGEFCPGSEIAIRVDQTLTHDAVGALIYLQLDSFKIGRAQTEVSASYLDHHILAFGPEDAQTHLYLAQAAREHGVYFSRAGNGICHQVHLERFGRPGATLLGSDSHTCTAGALGMLALGVGGCDAALAMAGKPHYLACPRVIKVELTGGLRPWASGRDVILHLLGSFPKQENTDFIMEYAGEGLAGLSVAQRATMANMAEELGALSALFPSDERTREFLRAQGREEAWAPLEADAGASYDQVVKVDLATLAPLASRPHDPAKVVPVKDLGRIEVSQVCIGTCTNGSLEDMRTVARMLKGKKVAPGLELVVSPASRQALQSLAQDGSLAELMAAGARISEHGCGICLGQTFKPPDGAVGLRTCNKNTPGRSGSPDAQVYLVSPQTAATSALAGVVTDPGDSGGEPPAGDAPARVLIDDGLLRPPGMDDPPLPADALQKLELGGLPALEPLPAVLKGRVAIKLGDGMGLDHILPGGLSKKYGLDPMRQADFLYANLDGEFARRAREIRERGGIGLVVAGEGYGKGSTKEHGALAARLAGIGAVMAKSIVGRHLRNLVNFGVLPLTFADQEDWERIEQGDEIAMPKLRDQVEKGSTVVNAENLSKGTRFELRCGLSAYARKLILAGGAASYWFGQ